MRVFVAAIALAVSTTPAAWAADVVVGRLTDLHYVVEGRAGPRAIPFGRANPEYSPGGGDGGGM